MLSRLTPPTEFPPTEIPPTDTMLLTALIAALAPQAPDAPEAPLRPTYEQAGFPLFGRLVAGVGDVDADGTPDLLVADTGGWRDEVKGEVAGVFVLSGRDGATLHAVFGERPGQAFAHALRAAGDVDADGYADWIVGVPDLDGARPGQAIVYSGRRGDALYRLRGEAPGDRFGWDVAGAGDVDADGHDDLVVAAPGSDLAAADAPRTNTGYVVVVSGATGELLHRVPGGASGSFGHRVRGAGDVDGDGRADVLVVRAFADRKAAHATSILSGADLSPLASVLSRDLREVPAVVTGVQDSDGALAFLVGGRGWVERVDLPNGTVRPVRPRATRQPADCGELRAALSDLDGDGVRELLFGGCEGIGVGRVDVRSGRDGRLVYSVAAELDDAWSFGASADAVGDVDGDGLSDFVVGCDHLAAGWAGRAWLHSGRDGERLFTFRREGGRVVAEPSPRALERLFEQEAELDRARAR